MRKVASTVAALSALWMPTYRAYAEVTLETVTVGNVCNAGELSGVGAGGHGPDRICGAVGYVYDIGKFEVTAAQYTAFLNGVAATDTYRLYDTQMWNSPFGCQIERLGAPGSYTYRVAAEWSDRPVNYVSWGDATRFANWLHNGQPSGAQDLSTTEDGSYLLNGARSREELLSVTREPGATWVIPSEDEWYKAAYHFNDGVTSNYWDQATQSNTAPTAEAPPGTDMEDGSANYYVSGFVEPTYYRTEVGAYDAKPAESSYGTYDQDGNVWEWNESVIDDRYRCTRGGSHNNPADLMRASVRNFSLPGSEHHSHGFRVGNVCGPRCNFDRDGDGDVDLRDYGLFQTAFTGPK